jgi:hypothetical protein
MTLLEKTYSELSSVGLVPSAAAFSADYLGKNKNWFAYQKHLGRDFSIDAAIQCLRRTRARQLAPKLTQAQQHALSAVEFELLTHLNAHHCVADVC